MSVVQVSQKEQSICLEKIIIMSLLKNKNLIFKTFFVCIFLSIQECYLTLFKDCLKIIKKNVILCQFKKMFLYLYYLLFLKHRVEPNVLKRITWIGLLCWGHFATNLLVTLYRLRIFKI